MRKNNLIFSFLLVILNFSCNSFYWKSIINTEGNFRISFPIKPTQLNSQIQSSFGLLNEKTLGCGYDGKNSLYSISYLDYPDSIINSGSPNTIIDSIFKNAVALAVKGFTNCKILEQKNIYYKIFPGTQAKLKTDFGFMFTKFYLVKNRLYIMDVGCTRDNYYNSRIDKFFDSFELINEIKKPA